MSSVENIRQYFHEVKDFYRNDMSEVGQTPIHFAAMTGQNHFVQNIIERIGAKVLLFRGNVLLNFQGLVSGSAPVVQLLNRFSVSGSNTAFNVALPLVSR